MSSDTIENVLILQGGGSLGAFGCGVFKALANNNIKIDIVAGTSIGGLNATIIAGSKEDHPERELEQFWLELAEGSSADLKFHDNSTPTVDSSSHTRISQAKSIFSFYEQYRIYILNRLSSNGMSHERCNGKKRRNICF